MIYVGGTIAQRGLAVLLLPVATRVLGVEQFGLVGTAVALATVLGLVYGLGLNFAIVRFYYDDPKDARRTGWAALLRAQAVVALVLAVATYLAGPWWSSALFPALGWATAFKVAVAYAWFTAMQSTVQGVLRAAQRPAAFVVVTLVQVGVGAGLGIGLATRWGAAGYIVGLGIGSAASVAIGLALTYHRPHWSKVLLISGLTLSLPALLHQISSWGIEAADRVLVAVYLGVSDVGRYQVAYVLGTALTMVLTGIQAAWAPYYIGNLAPDARRLTPPRVVVPISVVAGLATGLLVLATPYLSAILAPASFGGTEVVTALVASGTMARASYFMAIVVLLDRRKSGRLATASLVGVIVNVGLNVLLIPEWGLVGAALTTVIAVVIQAVLILAAAQRLLEMSMSIGRLCVLWVGGTGVLVVLALIPETALGLLLRILLAALIGVAGWMAVRWMRTSFDTARATAVTVSPGSAQ